MNKREKKNKKRAEKYVKTNFKIAKSILGGFRKGGKLKPTGEKKQDLPAKPTPGAMYSKGGGVTAPPASTPTSPAPVGSKVKVGSEKEDKIRKKKYARDGGEVKKKKHAVFEDLEIVHKRTRRKLKAIPESTNPHRKRIMEEKIKKESRKERRAVVDKHNKKLYEKKRYGGSVSYSSSQVRGYSKKYAGMGGEDE